MQLNPYLFYNGNCEAAFKYYQKVLGAKIEALMTHPTGVEKEDHARQDHDRWRGVDGL